MSNRAVSASSRQRNSRTAAPASKSGKGGPGQAFGHSHSTISSQKAGSFRSLFLRPLIPYSDLSSDRRLKSFSESLSGNIGFAARDGEAQADAVGARCQSLAKGAKTLQSLNDATAPSSSKEAVSLVKDGKKTAARSRSSERRQAKVACPSRHKAALLLNKTEAQEITAELRAGSECTEGSNPAAGFQAVKFKVPEVEAGAGAMEVLREPVVGVSARMKGLPEAPSGDPSTDALEGAVMKAPRDGKPLAAEGLWCAQSSFVEGEGEELVGQGSASAEGERSLTGADKMSSMRPPHDMAADAQAEAYPWRVSNGSKLSARMGAPHGDDKAHDSAGGGMESVSHMLADPAGGGSQEMGGGHSTAQWKMGVQSTAAGGGTDGADVNRSSKAERKPRDRLADIEVGVPSQKNPVPDKGTVQSPGAKEDSRGELPGGVQSEDVERRSGRGRSRERKITLDVPQAAGDSMSPRDGEPTAARGLSDFGTPGFHRLDIPGSLETPRGDRSSSASHRRSRSKSANSAKAPELPRLPAGKPLPKTGVPRMKNLSITDLPGQKEALQAKSPRKRSTSLAETILAHSGSLEDPLSGKSNSSRRGESAHGATARGLERAKTLSEAALGSRKQSGHSLSSWISWVMPGQKGVRAEAGGLGDGKAKVTVSGSRKLHDAAPKVALWKAFTLSHGTEGASVA